MYGKSPEEIKEAARQKSEAALSRGAKKKLALAAGMEAGVKLRVDSARQRIVEEEKQAVRKALTEAPTRRSTRA